MDLELGGLFSGITKRKLEKKVAQCKNQLIKDPHNPKLHLQLGELLSKSDQPQAALEHYHMAAHLLAQRHNPSKISTYLIEIYKKILSIAPDEQACENLAAEYNRIGKHTKAYDLYLSVGEQLYKRKHYKKALKLYQSALVLVSNSVVAHLRCAEIYQHLGQLEKCSFEYLKLVDLSLKRDKPSEALDYCKKALELTPSNPAVQTKMAEAYEKAGRTKEASVEYLNLANSYLEKGDPATALKYYKSCLAIDPGLSEVIQENMKAAGFRIQASGGEKLAFDFSAPQLSEPKKLEPDPLVPLQPRETEKLEFTSSALPPLQNRAGSPPEAPKQSPRAEEADGPASDRTEEEPALQLNGLEFDFTRPLSTEVNGSSGTGSSSRAPVNPTEEKIQALLQEKRLLEEKLKEQLKAEQLLKDKLEKALEGKRRLQVEFQEQLSRVEEEQNNLWDRTKYVVEAEIDSINDLKSLQSKIQILEKKLSKTSQEKAELQNQLSRQIAELKDKEKGLKAELAQIAQEKQALAEKLEALKLDYQKLQDAKRAGEDQFKQTIAELQANQSLLQEQLTALLKEKGATQQKLKVQAERLNEAKNVLKRELLRVNKLKRQWEQRLQEVTGDAKARGQEKLKAEIAKFQEEKQRLQSQLKAVTDSKAQIEAELMALKSERDHLQQARNRSDLKLKELTGKYVQMGKALKRLDQERRRLIERLSVEVTQRNRIKQELDQVKQAEQQLQREMWERLESEKQTYEASEKALRVELTKYQAAQANLRKELQERREKEAEWEAQLAELLAKGQETDSLKNRLREQLKKEEELNQKLNAIQVQYQQTVSQMLEEKTRLEEKIKQLQAESSIQRSIREQEIQKELQKSFQDKLQRVKAFYLQKIKVYQNKEARPAEKSKRGTPIAPSVNDTGRELEKKLEEIQETHKKLEAFLKETRAFEEAQSLQLKQGLEKIVAEIDKLERNFKEKIAVLEDKNTKTEAWLKEVLHPQNLKAFLVRELNLEVNRSDKTSRSPWLKGSRTSRIIVLFVLVLLSVLFFFRHMSYNEELVLRLDSPDILAMDLGPENNVTLELPLAKPLEQVSRTSMGQIVEPETPGESRRPLDQVEPRSQAGLTEQPTSEEPEVYQLPEKKGKDKSLQPIAKGGARSSPAQRYPIASSKIAGASASPRASKSMVYPTNLLQRRNQTPRRFLQYDLQDTLSGYDVYIIEERSFHRIERPYRAPYFEGPVKYLNGGRRPERPFRPY